MTEAELQKIINSISEGKEISDIEKQLVEEIKKEISKSINTSGGLTTGLNKSAGAVIKNSIKNFYESKKYQNSLQSILKKLEVASDSKITFYKDKNLKISKSSLTEGQKIVINEFIDNLSENGLNSKFNQPLRRLIYDSIRNNQSQEDLRKKIESKIVSKKEPSEFKRYYKNATIQAADAYTSIIDREVYRKFKSRITGYTITGTLIETSSVQCRAFIEQYNRKIKIGDELNDFIKFAIENGASEELTPENLPVLKLHYNCLHQFIPIIE